LTFFWQAKIIQGAAFIVFSLLGRRLFPEHQFLKKYMSLGVKPCQAKKLVM